MAMKFGLLLPHFGDHADREKLLEGSKRAEAVGFDSVWVRDHLLFEPHGEMESDNNSFYDALTTLTAIGAVTDRIELGHRFADPVPPPAPDGARRRHDDAAVRAPGHHRHGSRDVRSRVQRDRDGDDGQGAHGAGRVQRA